MAARTGAGGRPARRARRWRLAAAAILAVPAPACAAQEATSPGSPESSTPAAPAAPAQLLDPAAFEAFIAGRPGAPVINVHVPYEGHIQGTTDFVPFDTIEMWDGLPADRASPIVLYCRSGNMSDTAARMLAGLGYTDLVDLRGGMHIWEASGRTLAHDGPS